jgi:hypothetical protein
MISILQSHWLSLDSQTRKVISELFELERESELIALIDNEVTHDGYSPEELSKITVDRLQSILGSKETSLSILFDQLVDNIKEYGKPTKDKKGSSTADDIGPEDEESSIGANNDIATTPRKTGASKGNKK